MFKNTNRQSTGVQQNAMSPGVQPKVSPLAQNSSNGSNGNSSPAAQCPQTTQVGSGSVPPPPPPPPSMGSLAMGMPFQVFPTGPAVGQNNKQLSAPQTNGNNRKSPQAFEPPPMGCRPEIKIPANPMALLKSAPRPQPKSDFWVQEYVQEKTSDPIPSEEETAQQYASNPIIQQQQYQPSTPSSAPPQKQQSPVRYAPRSPSPPQQRDYRSPPIRNVVLDDIRTSSPVQVNRSSPVRQNTSQSNLPSPMTPAATARAVVQTFEPFEAYIEPQQSYQPPTPTYQQPTQAYQPQAQMYQPQAQMYQQPQQGYQQPQQSYQQPQQNYQQPTPGGGRVILSTMPKHLQQAAQQHVRFLNTYQCL